MTQLTCTILRGLQASGKSTWGKQLQEENPGKYKIVNKDSLRNMLDSGVWSWTKEKFIIKARNSLILLALDQGFHVIVDDTNFGKHEEEIRTLVGDLAIVHIQNFTSVPLEECIARDKKRPNYVGEDVIRKTYNKYLRPTQPAPPTIEVDHDLYHAIIVDLDGTLALHDGRNPYDTAKCESDRLNVPIETIVHEYTVEHDSGYRLAKLLLVSGRKEKYRPETEHWLAFHGIEFEHLWMRADGDDRKDVEVKRDIYNERIAGKYNISFVLDDRNQVVELWRSLGLTCLQVADGDF